MTAPVCPAHKKPGRYVFGSMVTCSACDAELEAERKPTRKVSESRTLPPQRIPFGFQYTTGPVYQGADGGYYVDVTVNAPDDQATRDAVAQQIQDSIHRALSKTIDRTRIPARQALDPLFDFTDTGDDS